MTVTYKFLYATILQIIGKESILQGWLIATQTWSVVALTTGL